jgi:PIN domain nuclease of toxin-antitoxin system
VKDVCIDTHALIWYLSRPKRLGRRAHRLLKEADAGRAVVHVPAIVAIELSLLRKAGRKTVGVLELEALLKAQPAFRLLPMDLAQAKEFALLETVADPFDRLILAATRAHGAPLVTADVAIHDSALVEAVWD